MTSTFPILQQVQFIDNAAIPIFICQTHIIPKQKEPIICLQTSPPKSPQSTTDIQAQLPQKCLLFDDETPWKRVSYPPIIFKYNTSNNVNSILGTNISETALASDQCERAALLADDGGEEDLLAEASHHAELHEDATFVKAEPLPRFPVYQFPLVLLLLLRSGSHSELAHDFLLPFLDDVLQESGAQPRKAWFFAGDVDLVDESQRFEDVDDVVESSNFGFNHGGVFSRDENSCCFLKGEWIQRIDEEFEKSIGQMFQRFLLFVCARGVAFSQISDLMDGPDGFLESAPNIMILACLFDDVQTLQDVDDVVDASAFDVQLDGHLIEFQDQVVVALEVVDELFAKFLQTLLLTVVGQDLLFYLLFVQEFLETDAGGALGHLKQRSAQRQQPRDQEGLLILRETGLLRQE